MKAGTLQNDQPHPQDRFQSHTSPLVSQSYTSAHLIEPWAWGGGGGGGEGGQGSMPSSPLTFLKGMALQELQLSVHVIKNSS